MEYFIFKCVASFLFSLWFALYITPLMSRIAYRFNILDLPDGNLKKHNVGTPYLGGLAIYFSFITTLGLFFPFHNTILWLLIGVTFLLFLGLIDDLVILTPFQKWWGQFLAILFFLKGGVALKAEFFSESLNIILSAFWMLSVINAFNLIDVMDGLASSLALSSAAAFLFLSLLSNLPEVTLLLVSFMGGVLGFFYFNRPQAKIYLGDCGALFIGGFLAAVPFLFKWSSYTVYAYCVPLFILAVPLGEVCLLVMLRTWEGIPFYRGSHHHFSLLLRNQGYTKNFILILSNFYSLLVSFLSLALLYNRVSFLPFTLLVGTLAIFTFAFLMRGYKRCQF